MNMQFWHHHKVFGIFLLCGACLLGLIIIEFLIIKYNGQPVTVPSIPRKATTTGTGPHLSYVILGDSTAVGQGGDYSRGIASSTTQHIVNLGYQVTMQNLAVSGARSADVAKKQLAEAVHIKPDVVLIAVGANDVTHVTSLRVIKQSMEQIIRELKAANPRVKIILTGSPQMGSVPRFPQPVKYYAKVQTAKVNNVFDTLVTDGQIIRASIAEDTGPIFIKNPKLFARDKFHPRSEGYEVWTPVLERAIDDMLALHQ